MLKLVPRYPTAAQKMRLLLEREANANVVRMTVKATEEWQDSGVDVMQGKPVAIRSAGVWTFNLTMKVGPEGIKIPKELREYNLGCLIAAVRPVAGGEIEPFVVGKEKSFVAEKSGRLFLRMYDVAPADNDGEMNVEIRGSFDSRNKKK